MSHRRFGHSVDRIWSPAQLIDVTSRPRLQGGACEQRQDEHRLGAPDPRGRTRHRHLLSAARGYGLPRREHPNRVPLLRERSVDQRDVHHRPTPTSAWSGSSSPKGWKSPRSSPRGSNSRRRSQRWPEPIRGSYFAFESDYWRGASRAEFFASPSGRGGLTAATRRLPIVQTTATMDLGRLPLGIEALHAGPASAGVIPAATAVGAGSRSRLSW